MRFSQTLWCGLAALVATADANASNGQPVLINKSMYSTIVRYTRFSSASYNATIQPYVCAYVPYGAKLINTLNITSTDTQAVIFQDDKAREIIVSFPGTDSSRDFQTDYNLTMYPFTSAGINCPKCMVAGGYLEAYNSVLPALRKALNKARKAHPGYTITVTGHSLGGALSGLAYPSLKGLDFPVKQAYTFGQPRTGNTAYASLINKLAKASNSSIGNYVRVTHSYDGVPNLPPTSLNFTHSLTEIFERDIYKSNGTLVPKMYDVDANTNVITQAANATYRCFGASSPYCNAGYASGFINQAHLHYSGVQMIGGGCPAPA